MENKDYMTVHEISKSQFRELKMRMLDQRLMEAEGRTASMGELVAVDDFVFDEDVFEEYEGVMFCEDDFVS